MKYPKRICVSTDCKKSYTPIRKDQKFCSPRCSNRESQRIYREQQREKATA